jgi:RNA polymerase sigma factor (sigma-70 family)
MHKAIETVWRMESPKLIGGLVRIVHDIGLAEDLAQDALVMALERWPETGIPDNPGAWLMTIARNKAIDQLRHHQMRERKHVEIAGHASRAPSEKAEEFEQAVDDGLDDDVLRLMLIASHPVLSKEARAALTLRLLGGLSTEEIARAFLVPPPTIAQRIVRAKRTLAEARVPFEVPRGSELSGRIPSVLEVIYLIYNEGYTATRGDDWMRPTLCDEALRLGRVLAERIPEDAEVHGLVALLEIQSSRSRARTDRDGNPVLLSDQDRSRWDQLLIGRGLAALKRAESLRQPLGPYSVQAAIAACHARARTASETEWVRIVALYDALVEMTQSPVVELNRAVAVAMAFGAEEGLASADELLDEPALESYHLLPSVRGDLLEKLGRLEEARREFERAAKMTQNGRERELLLSRCRACRGE